MSVLVEASDVATFLGVDDIDTNRAVLLIDLAEGLAETIVSPLPDGAKATIITAVARAYENPVPVTQEVVGPYQASRPGGIYFNKYERAALRRANGGGSAFSYDLLPAGYPDSVFTE